MILCEWKTRTVILAASAVLCKKTWKNSCLKGIWNYWPCDTETTFWPNELTRSNWKLAWPIDIVVFFNCDHWIVIQKSRKTRMFSTPDVSRMTRDGWSIPSSSRASCDSRIEWGKNKRTSDAPGLELTVCGLRRFFTAFVLQRMVYNAIRVWVS